MEKVRCYVALGAAAGGVLLLMGDTHCLEVEAVGGHPYGAFPKTHGEVETVLDPVAKVFCY